MSNIKGNASGIYGDVSNIKGNASGIYGDVSNIKGYVSGIIGDVSGIIGDIDECELSEQDRQNEVNIQDLII